MTAYLDSSVVLRVIFGEPGRLKELDSVAYAVSSELSKVECLQAIDRMRVRLALPDEEVALRSAAVFEFMKRMEIIPLAPSILDRAGMPFSTQLGTLDAIHLSSALLWEESEAKQLVLMTHDEALGLAAKASGMEVIGCSPLR